MRKHCVMGNHEAPVADFGPNKKTTDGLTCSCRPCRRERYGHLQKARYKEDRIKINKDRFQVASFQAFFHAAVIGPLNDIGNYYALESAIVGSSDDATRLIPEGSVQRWLDFCKAERSVICVNVAKTQ